MRPIMVPKQVVLLRDRLMERTALDGGQLSSGDRPKRSYGANSGMVPRFDRRWPFVTKRSPGDSSSRMVLMKERDSEC